MTTTEAPEHEAGSDADLLAALREADEEIREREITKLRLTVAWSLRHQLDPTDPTEERSPAVLHEYPAGPGQGFYDRYVPIAGVGAPVVSEFAVTDYAATLDMSTDAGKALVGRALEIRYRLPRLWQRIMDGDLEVWKATRIADATRPLSADAADFVDRHLAGVTGKIHGRIVDRLVGEALARFDPDKATERTRKAAELRHFDIGAFDADSDLSGHVGVHGVLDAADALDLQEAVRAKATELANLGCEDSLDVRRSMAVGEIARTQLAFDFDQKNPNTAPSKHHGRAVKLVVHISDAAFTAAGFQVGRVENTQRPVDAEMVRQWSGTAGTITVQPVIDLNNAIHVEQYEVPDRLKQQAAWIHQRCVFPHCTKQAQNTDCDHIHPYREGGATCTCNLAPLCRPHHRAKTHGNFRYRRLAPGKHEWTLPSGSTVIRDHRGTHPPQPPEPPDE